MDFEFSVYPWQFYDFGRFETPKPSAFYDKSPFWEEEGVL
jgi:hypothetical protein